ncbi:MAG: hypothetical protein JW910_22945, partial [Anaerolineae bacterium]|nr:hypothetical protein [Anaerolineae bacterium]
MRILWLANAPWSPTGYGTGTARVIWHLKDQGHEVIVLAFYGLQGAPLKANGILVLPGGRDPYGNDVCLADYEYHNCDVVISFMDVWVLNPGLMSRMRWYPWLPVDHDPTPPAVVSTLQAGARRPIAYCKWGAQKLREAGFDPLMVPLSVPTDEFFPVDRAKARQALGCPEDRFLVGMVAANKGMPSRKAFDEHVRAFKVFQQRHNDAMLYLHTEFDSPHGISISQLLRLNEIPPESVAQPSPYQFRRGLIDNEFMRHAYSAMDV